MRPILLASVLLSASTVVVNADVMHVECYGPDKAGRPATAYVTIDTDAKYVRYRDSVNVEEFKDGNVTSFGRDFVVVGENNIAWGYTGRRSSSRVSIDRQTGEMSTPTGVPLQCRRSQSRSF